jgi:hypothetical protein
MPYIRKQITGTTPLDIKNIEDNFKALWAKVYGNMNISDMGTNFGNSFIKSNAVAVTASKLNLLADPYLELVADHTVTDAEIFRHGGYLLYRAEKNQAYGKWYGDIRYANRPMVLDNNLELGSMDTEGGAVSCIVNSAARLLQTTYPIVYKIADRDFSYFVKCTDDSFALTGVRCTLDIEVTCFDTGMTVLGTEAFSHVIAEANTNSENTMRKFTGTFKAPSGTSTFSISVGSNSGQARVYAVGLLEGNYVNLDTMESDFYRDKRIGAMPQRFKNAPTVYTHDSHNNEVFATSLLFPNDISNNVGTDPTMNTMLVCFDFTATTTGFTTVYTNYAFDGIKSWIAYCSDGRPVECYPVANPTTGKYGVQARIASGTANGTVLVWILGVLNRFNGQVG